MIGAIKRRWKSKKAKVLHKGGELSTTSDSCPASRGFVDGCEDFDKMIKPPSPRQIHPVLEKGDPVKCPLPHTHTVHSCHANNKKSSTLPHHSEEACPFIRVNSGRIELVSGGRAPGHPPARFSPPSLGPAHRPINENEVMSRMGGRLRNDSRHSWCGSALRDGVPNNRSKVCMSGLVLAQDPAGGGPEENGNGGEEHYSTTAEEQEILRLRTSLLQERLEVLEVSTRASQGWQTAEKSETNRCMSDLASQVSRAVTLHQLMKSEVEKLQQRVIDLESSNRAMATMIIPTLMKLQETVGVEKEGGPSGAEKIGESCGRMTKSDSPTQEGDLGVANNLRSPKHRKLDCRIPTRMNSRLSRTASNPPPSTKPSSGSAPNSPGKVSKGPSHPSRLSPFQPSKSESSSPSSNAASPHRSSTYSGIPRMSSPHRPPATPAPQKPSSSSLPLSSGPRARSQHRSEPPKAPADVPSSRLPVRKAPASSILLRPTKAGVLTSGIPVKSVGGKDEGYSTMSSEALAEQENASGSGTVEKAIEKFNGLNGSSKALQKSSTFSTFRETQAAAAHSIQTEGPSNFTSLPSTSVHRTSFLTSNNVRIVRGRPGSFDIELDEHGGEEPSSTSTILWEDSDDSDILFLPLEMSSGTSSPSTLVPDSLRSSSQSTTATESQSSRSAALPPSISFSAEGRVLYPLRRTRGDEVAALLGPDHDELEERALIEKWMRLEDVRNQVQVEEEWAWDWDGVERAHKRRETVDESEFWFYPENKSRPEVPPEDVKEVASGKIDTSTWTKSKGSSLKKKEEASEDSGLAPTESPATCTTATSPSPPPAIEFTPEYYRLVKYGSSGSVNDNELLVRSEEQARSRRLTSVSSDESPPVGGKMDDKISQTDFGSSLENLSISSELFTECRNCLELVKRLVGGIDEASNGGGRDFDASSTTTLDRVRDSERDELGADHGSPSTWVSVPKGLPTTEVDRIFEILSSSESEDVLSPTLGK